LSQPLTFSIYQSTTRSPSLNNRTSSTLSSRGSLYYLKLPIKATNYQSSVVIYFVHRLWVPPSPIQLISTLSMFIVVVFVYCPIIVPVWVFCREYSQPSSSPATAVLIGVSVSFKCAHECLVFNILSDFLWARWSLHQTDFDHRDIPPPPR
jgi:hypothetical protein